MDDVAIIGVGLHPFGRHGDKSAYEMAADAVELALTDAGVTWNDVQCAFGGSWGVWTDPLTGLVGLTGLPFIHVFSACATGAATIQQATNAIRAGNGDIVVAVGTDKHARGSFKGDPTTTNVPTWYGENGQYVTTKFFGMKINKYMHDHGVSQATLAKVAAKNYRNGALNPKAFRRKPITEEEILSSQMLNYPLTSYMFCAPDEGAAAVVLCRADIARRFTDTPVYVKATAIRTRNYGSYEVNTTWAPVDEDVSPTVHASAPPTKTLGSGPRTLMSSRSRTPTRAPKSSTWLRTASVLTATRRSFSRTALLRSRAQCRLTPTADSSPTESRSELLASARSTSSCSSSAARPATAKSRVTRSSVMPRSTGLPAPPPPRSSPAEGTDTRSQFKGGFGSSR